MKIEQRGLAKDCQVQIVGKEELIDLEGFWIAKEIIRDVN